MKENAKHSELNQEDSNQEKQTQESGNTYLLRAAVIFLAVVSFFTTANGMKEYIFRENGVIAYTASAAIQGILLALSMNLPGYLRSIWMRKWNVVVRCFMIFMALLLTSIAIFCSSWFSYIYIAEVIHKDSWGTDSELLVQQTYRTQLYDARDYAHTYRLYLEESMGDHIVKLEEQAREQLKDSVIDFRIDWDTEEADYASDGGTAASYMIPVITAMRRAAASEPSQEDRDQAARAVADARDNIGQRTENIRQRMDTISTNLDIYNRQITNLNNRIQNATEGTDVGALTNALNNYTQMFETATQEQTALELESTQLDRALTRLSVYESLLGLNSSTSAITIRSALLEMQSEFFKQEPDEARLLDIAQEIFQNLRSASNEQATGGNVQSYAALLSQMNRLIRNLTDYSEIKDIELTLEELIVDLRTATESIGVKSDPGQVPGSNSSGSSTQTAKDDEEEGAGTQWKEAWGKRLSDLRAQISAMPAYSQSEGDGDSVLSEDQLNILRGYDRDAASRALDDMIRRYIANHNAIYQGIIYLQSPYHQLAFFALLLALSFDLAGFIFGIVIEGTGRSSHMFEKYIPMRDGGQTKWSILETLHQYYVLTGDYERRDGVYHYKAFRNGLLEDWAVTDSEPYQQGIYRQDREKETVHLGAVGQEEQRLRFANQPAETAEPMFAPSQTQPEEARDGIYLGGQLLFNEGSLLRVMPEGRYFLASVEEYVPVHCYVPHRGENRTIPIKQLTKEIDVQIAVVALNRGGTRVAAIYVIEKNA